MLGFTLSKLNLLILVTAVFSIIAFFMFSLTGLIVSNLSQQLVNDYSETIFSLVSGEMLCRKTTVTVPESIEYFGGLSPSKSFYYIMNIKRYPEEPVEGKLNSLIFQIADRKQKDEIIATKSIDVNAEILLYDWDPDTDIIKEQSSITLDPESAGIATKNSMVIIKELFNGKNYLHIIACSASAGLCERNLGRAACWLSTCTANPRTTTCFPQPENCAASITCGG